MLAPLRYITSMQEYDNIRQADNVRSQVEAFWLDAFGERDRARQAIRTYYGRVENANRYFTTWIEGWRTDRAWCTSSSARRTRSIGGTNSEAVDLWRGQQPDVAQLRLRAARAALHGQRPGAGRDPTFKGAWYRNVESWRNGRVY